MLDHVSITVSDIAAAERFYDAIMKALGVVKVGRRDDWLGYGERARPPIRTASISPSARGRSPRRRSAATGASRRAGRPRSMRSGTPASPPAAPTTGAPGLRDYHASYYGAFLRDPDGNRVEAVCHHAL